MDEEMNVSMQDIELLHIKSKPATTAPRTSLVMDITSRKLELTGIADMWQQ